MARYDEWRTEDGLLQLTMWAEDGLDDVQIRKAMGVSESTFYTWKKRFPEISEAIRRGRRCALVQIRQALRARANGGVQILKKPIKRRVREYDPITGRCTRDEEIIEYVDEQVWVSPDTNAIKFYLVNKDSEHFAEKVELTGEGALRIDQVVPDE